MLQLKENPILKDYQEYVEKLELERGFRKEDILQKCLLLGEEVGELNKAVRKNFKLLKVDENSSVKNIGDELADIIIILCTIANRLNINLEKAFREKEEINKKRAWN